MTHPTFRMYVDEVGNSDLGSSHDPNHRHLSLTGVILELDYVKRVVQPAIEALKREHFGSHPDDPVILHRKEMLRKEGPFTVLKDDRIRSQFDQELLSLIETTDFTALTVVIDKQEHNQRYSSWRMDPYHYCLHILLERYVLYLRKRALHGDVLAESRGGKEDRRLKDSFERVVAGGTDYIGAEVFAEQLTSKQLKVKPKANNIAGLQLADLVAYPAYRLARWRRENENIPEDFGGKVAVLLRDRKLNRDSAGKLDGWGIKWLP